MTSEDVVSLRGAIDVYDHGDTAHAEPVLRILAQRYPANYEASEALGSLYAETDQPGRALLFLERSCKLAPREALAHANLGAVYLKLNRLDDAAQELQRAAKLDPANPQTQANLGRALMLQKHPAEAAKAFAAASGRAPADPDLNYNLALALSESGSNREAAAALDRIPEASMTEETHLLAAQVDEASGRFAPALQHFQAAARLNPSDANLYALSIELLRHWNWAEAIQVAAFGAGRYPGSTRFLLLKGIGLYGKNDYPAATVLFSAMLEADPENSMLADLLGRTCAALPDNETAACGGVASFAERHPGNAIMMTYAANAILHEAEGKRDLPRAAALLQGAIAASPSYPEAYLRLGILEQEQMHWQESAVALEHAIALRPDLAEAHYRLSRAYAHLGRRDDAKREVALHQQYAQAAKDALDARMREVMRFVINPT